MPRSRAFRITAWLAAAILALVAIVLIIGFFLPEQHRAERAAIIRGATVEQVYALISDVERFPSWRSDVTRVEVEEREPELRFREYDGDDSILFVIDSTVPNERWVARIADMELPFGGRWVFTIRPAVGGTELRIVEEGEVYNPFFRFVSKFVTGHSSMIERYLEDVQAWFASEQALK